MNRIDTLDKLQQFSTVANTFSIDKLIPFEYVSTTKYLDRWFSSDLLDQIFNYDTEAETSIEGRAYKALMAAHVCFSMLEYSKEGEITIGDLGFTRTENENTKSAYAAQMKMYREQQEDLAFMHVGKLIEILDEDETTFADWLTSPGYTNRSLLLVRSAKDFNAIQRLYRMNTTFIELIPNMIEVQDLELRPFIGSTLINEIIANAPGMHADKVIARGYLITALVNLTMGLSLRKGLVKLTPTGAMLFGHDYNTSTQNESAAMPDHTSGTYHSFLETGKRYLNNARAHLVTANIITDESSTPTRFWAS